jgi:hypothetical protein
MRQHSASMATDTVSGGVRPELQVVDIRGLGSSIAGSVDGD